MELTSARDLSKGIWFARRIGRKEEKLDKQPWTIAVIIGEYPFLFGRCYIYANRLEGEGSDQILEYNGEITRPSEWEFGPKIEFPED